MQEKQAIEIATTDTLYIQNTENNEQEQLQTATDRHE